MEDIRLSEDGLTRGEKMFEKNFGVYKGKLLRSTTCVVQNLDNEYIEDLIKEQIRDGFTLTSFIEPLFTPGTINMIFHKCVDPEPKQNPIEITNFTGGTKS